MNMRLIMVNVRYQLTWLKTSHILRHVLYVTRHQTHATHISYPEAATSQGRKNAITI